MPGDSVLVISVEDSCRQRTDTIFVAGGALTNGSVVLKAPSDSTITFRYSHGRRMWVMRIDTIPADTTKFLWYTYITPVRYDTSFARAFAPDTIQFVTKPVHWDDIIGKPLSATYFFHEDTSDLAGYNYLRPVPADHPQHVHNLAVTSGPPTLFHQFATDSVGSSVFIPAGKWIVHMYGYVNNAAGGSHIWTEILHRAANGTETSLFTLTTPMLTTSLQRYELEYYGPQQVMNVGDRMLARVYAYTTSVPSRTVTFVMEGDTAASHIHFPAIYEGEPPAASGTDTTFLQLRDTPDDYTGHSGKLVAVKATGDGLEFVSPTAGGRQIIGYANYLGVPVDTTADYVWLAAVNGIVIGHEFSITGDTIQYIWSLDWDWVRDSVEAWASGASTFLELTDTPASYSGNAGKVVKVNPSADALVFADDNVGGGSGGGMTYDTTNVFVHDSAYIFEGRWMKPRLIGEQPPTGTYIQSTDSLLVKTAIGWKEFEVHYIRPQGSTTQIEFEAFADSANGRFLLCAIGFTMDALEIGGLSIIGNLEYNITGIVFAASAATWYQNVTSGVLRSGATASRPSITSFVYPGAESRADGHRSVYYNRVQLYSTRSVPMLYAMVIRVYYGRRLDSAESASDWDVTLKF